MIILFSGWDVSTINPTRSGGFGTLLGYVYPTKKQMAIKYQTCRMTACHRDGFRDESGQISSLPNTRLVTPKMVVKSKDFILKNPLIQV